ncbi:MAG: TonB-dependent copper receptor [Magnetococcales bacterium]|nr:TonB-dependent copper receptor [Magnetococcales bacterium]
MDNKHLPSMGNFPPVLSLLVGLLACSSSAYAESERVLIVEDTRIAAPATASVEMEQRDQGPVTDGGDLLKTVPGISTIRIGGHGTDPVIRGQTGNRLNIMLDGAYVMGGCPNRMDPPSSYAASETYDQVTITKGVQSLSHGGGGGGGTVQFERTAPEFGPDWGFSGKAGGGYTGNSDTKQGFLDLATGNDRAFIRAIGNLSQGNDYEDGDGNSVRAAFKESTGNIMLGLTPSANQLIQLSYEATRARDLTYAGAGMDTPYTDNDTLRLKWKLDRPGSLVSAIRAELYGSQVAHLMDNYSLRPVGAMYMSAPSTSDTWGGRIKATLKPNEAISYTIGVDHQNNQRDASRYTGMSAAMVNTLQSVLWPDVSISTSGIFAEANWNWTESRSLKAALRWDHVSAEADRADEDPAGAMNYSPDAIYAIYYGTGYESSSENNIGGLLRLEQDIMDGDATLHASISRTVRTADATERYLAANNMTAAMRWVGNPHLDPEQNHQVEVGIQGEMAAWSWDFSVMANKVSDYILRDRAHRADAAGNATIYRNVDALFLGGEAAVNYRWNDQFTSGLTIAYTWAENETDNRPLAQIPPLEMGLTSDYTADKWSVGGKLRLTSKQTRVDDDTAVGSGLDSGETPGFGVFDMYGSVTPIKDFKIKLGVNNLFDRAYAEHLNRSSSFDPTQVQVNEPGRSIWLSGVYKF